MRRIVSMSLALAVTPALVGLWSPNASAGETGKATYVGNQKCKMCHKNQYKACKKTKHAKAYKKLTDEQKRDPDYLKRYTVGYGQPGGFVDWRKSTRLKGVQCESCHGPGSEHHAQLKKAANEEKSKREKRDIAKATMIRPVEVCGKCHGEKEQFGLRSCEEVKRAYKPHQQ